ncbi:MAG: RHS repeat protein [Betaproteobacteria bacterium]|nr:RHS repeat protein [Betaproteobacteria bacterium]
MGFTLDFTNAGGRITRVADGARQVDYTYDANGNFASYTNATGGTATYQYDLLGRLTANFFPSNPGVAYITNVYDSLGRVKTQTLANGKVTSLFFAGTRSEQVAPDGSSTVSYVDAMGKFSRASIRWAVSRPTLTTASRAW